jgi:hypothetical protein
MRTEMQALAELHRCAGTQFDRAVIAVLEDALCASSETVRTPLNRMGFEYFRRTVEQRGRYAAGA